MKYIHFAGMTFIQSRTLLGWKNDKFNRVTKLAIKMNSILSKLDSLIDTNEKPYTGTVFFNQQCALAIKIAIFSGIRIGNEDSSNGYITKPHPNEKDKKPEFRQTYGLTTLKHEHVKVKGSIIEFKFTGKKGVDHHIRITDRKLSSQVKLNLKNQFKDGYFLDVSDHMVRFFVRKKIGHGFVPKDFRTLFANCVFSKMILERKTLPKLTTKRDYKNELRVLVGKVADQLGNTVGVSKTSYIDPKLIDLHHELRMVS